MLLILGLLVLVLIGVAWTLVQERRADLRDARLSLTGESVGLARVLEATLDSASVIAKQVAADAGVTMSQGTDLAMDRFQTRLTAFVKGFPGMVGIVVHGQSGRLVTQVTGTSMPKGTRFPPPDPEIWALDSARSPYQVVDNDGTLLRVVSPVIGDMGDAKGIVSVVMDLDHLLALQDKPGLCREASLNGVWLLARGACPEVVRSLSGEDRLGGTSRVDAAGTLTVSVSMSRRQALEHWTTSTVVTLIGTGGFVLLLVIALLFLLRSVANQMAWDRRKDQENAQLAEALLASGLGTWTWNAEQGTGEMRGGGLDDRIFGAANWLDRVLPRDRGALRAALEAQDRGVSKPLDTQVRLDLGEKTVRWIRFRGQLVVKESIDGRVHRVTGLWADVTEQNDVAMERLRLATAVEKGPVAVMMTDAEGRIDYVNRKFQDMMGYAPSDVLGQRPEMIGSGMTDPSVFTEMWSRISQERDWSGEIINRHRDGYLVWHQVSISPIQADGATIGLVSVHEDISDRRRLQENLNRQIAMMRAVLDISPNGILMADLHGRPRMINLRLRRLWNLDPDILSTEEPGILFETMARKVAEPKEFLDTIRALNETPREPEIGLEILFRDGRVIERHSLAVEDETGMPWGRVWFFREVTEQKRVERALSDQLEFQHTLLDTLPSPVFHMDRQERFLGCNRAFGVLVDRSPEAVFGATADELFSHERARRLTEGNRDLLAKGGMDIREITLMDTNGVFRDMAMSKAAFTDAQGQVNGVVGILTDVSTLKKATDELRRSNQELEQFAYVASHDLQEPLRMVSSYLGLLKRRYADRLDGDAEEFIGYAVDGAHRMQDLIQDLLHFSRIDTRGNPLEPTSTRLCLDMALDNLRIAFEEAGAKLTVPLLPQVLADDAQLTSLFQNLLGNAVKYRAPDRPPDIRIQVSRDGDYWRFSVADNGIGIDPRFSEKVFMIFQRLQTRDRYPGTGIGLAVVKKIVERHGGRIWLEGEEGVGTTFHFTLRAIPEELDALSESLA
ncbi:MAG: PAS domain S-box protein [Rhodospirillum sp.]|nr:PAS domain S-box protein [Rhodospirillum sp.]MCF8489102.1 PAS domain S-box protein [Rhodospirillum sp.]MCF8498892.1 PAS domain S-box protein [Rhodospirillum sp.]